MSGYHAILSPSGAHRWMNCAAAPAMERNFPDKSSKFADEGTCAHFLGALCLEKGDEPLGYKDCTIVIWSDPIRKLHGTCFKVDVGQTEATEITYEITPDEDFCRHVQTYVDNVRKYAQDNVAVYEQKVPIDHITGEKDATGTSDVIIFADGGDELQSHDLKFGMGEEVSPVENVQCIHYGLGSLVLARLAGYEPKRFRAVIHQPRTTNAPLEWTCTIGELEAFGEMIKPKAFHALQVYHKESPDAYQHHLNASPKTCRWCKAAATCPASTKLVEDQIGAGFPDLSQATMDPAKLVGELPEDNLGVKMSLVDYVEKWCKAVRAEVERRLLAGGKVPGWKLVQGRQGNRAWLNADEVEKYMKETMRLKTEEMFDFSLISATSAEKLQKAGVIGPKQWKKLEAMIGRREGVPSVAPEADKRPALDVKPVADGFAVLEEEAALI